MFPFFELFDGFIIYTFGLTITLCFFLFLWMLKKLSLRFNYDYNVFTNNILWYFLSVFIFSRLIYVIGKWNELKYIKDPFEFFIMNNYNFSLMGAILGFMLVIGINSHLKKEKILTYIDGIVLSLLFILPIGYLGSLLGGQVYGRETLFGIEILYNHPFTPVPFQVPIFPLPIVYALLFFLLFSGAYMLSMFIHIRGLVGYLSAIIGACLIVIFEFFSGKYDIVKDSFIGMNLTQLLAFVIIGVCSYKAYEILQEKK